MAGDIIKEFLVAVGFKTDEPTLKRFKDSIESATLRANLLANAITEMAKTVAENIIKSAGQLESLYYTAVRTGSSATQLKALGQAAQDFGVSAEEAIGNVERLREQLYREPGKEQFLNTLGVKTRESNGELRNTVDIMNDIGKVLAKAPSDALSAQLADVLGVTYKFQRAIRDPGWLDDLEKHVKLLSAGDYENAARKAAMLEQQWRVLQDRWQALRQRFEVPIFQTLLDYFEAFSRWLDTNAPAIEGYINRIASALERVYKIAKLLHDHLDLTKMLGLGEYSPKNTAVQNFVQKYIADPMDSAASKVWNGMLDKLGIRKEVQGILSSPDTDHFAARNPGIDSNNPLNLEYAGQPGAKRFGGGPYAGRFAAFATPGQGLEAGARQLELYAARGLTSIQQIVAKWAPPGENDTGAYIADVATRMHRGAGEHLNLQDPSVLTSLMNAMIWHEQAKNPYPAGLVRGAAEGAVRQSGDTTINQNNHFEINGAQHPQATKQAVQEALQDAFSRANRNLAPTTQ